MKIKHLLRIVIIICVLIPLLLFFYSKIFLTQASQDPLAKQVMKNPIVISDREYRDSTENHKMTEKIPSTPEMEFTNADAHENIQSLIDRGIFSAEEQETYNNYDTAALEGMAINLDLHAITELGDRQTEAGDFNKATEYFWRAAAIGSTSVLAKLAFLASEPLPTLNETKEERSALRKSGAIEALALSKVALHRGDYDSALIVKTTKRHYEMTEQKPLVLADEDLMIIDIRAAEIYNTLQERRREMGLGEFDNATSKIGEMIHNMRNK